MADTLSSSSPQPRPRWRGLLEQVLTQAGGTVLGGVALYLLAALAGIVRFHAGYALIVLGILMLLAEMLATDNIIDWIWGHFRPEDRHGLKYWLAFLMFPIGGIVLSTGLLIGGSALVHHT